MFRFYSKLIPNHVPQGKEREWVFTWVAIIGVLTLILAALIACAIGCT